MGCCNKAVKIGELAIKSGTAFIANKGQKERLDIIQKRLSICNNCDSLKGKTCDHCKCNMLIKTQYKGMKCPLNKW